MASKIGGGTFLGKPSHGVVSCLWKLTRPVRIGSSKLFSFTWYEVVQTRANCANPQNASAKFVWTKIEFSVALAVALVEDNVQTEAPSFA